jgi:dephospho-CoA kinase
MLTRPFTRLVVAFGVRKITQRLLVEELVIGILLLIPFGFVVGLITSRICTKFSWQRKFIRSDIWTTLVVFLVGDIMMELLLPSLSCLPMIGVGSSGEDGHTLREDEYIYNMTWIAQSFGLWCPPNFASSESLLSPDATAILFSLRLVFLCVGVHVGESLCFVALTGGIATGKSTVASIFVDHNNTESKTSRNYPGSMASKRKSKRAVVTSNQSGASSNNNNTTAATDDGYKEGTVYLICADTIAHEVILPPNVLARGKQLYTDDESDDDGGQLDGTKHTGMEFLVQPSDSVYPQIIDSFHGKDILAKNGHIDRLKLGAIIFSSKEERRVLNRITHPRILTILIRSLLRGVFFGSCDIVMADVPLLFESGKLSWLFGVTICVVTDPDVQLERLIKRNPELTKKQCQERIDSQMPLSRKAKMADIVIENSGSLENLNEQIEEVRKDLMGRLYGIGMSLLQMLLLIGGSTSIAVSSKFYTNWQQ